MTLPAMMTALVLLAAFAALGTQVLRATLRASRQAGDAATVQTRFDGALTQLRRDAWGASGFEAADTRTARILRPGQPAVTWNVSGDGTLVRTLAATGAPAQVTEEVEPARREWPGIGRNLSFAVDGGVLSLVEAGGAEGRGRRIPLVSQLVLANPKGGVQ